MKHTDNKTCANLSDKSFQMEEWTSKVIYEEDVKQAVRELKEKKKKAVDIQLETEVVKIKDLDEIFGDKLI